jgi:hypothetical protein
MIREQNRDNLNRDNLNKDNLNKDNLNKDNLNKDSLNRDNLNKDNLNKVSRLLTQPKSFLAANASPRLRTGCARPRNNLTRQSVRRR